MKYINTRKYLKNISLNVVHSISEDLPMVICEFQIILKNTQKVNNSS